MTYTPASVQIAWSARGIQSAWLWLLCLIMNSGIGTQAQAQTQTITTGELQKLLQSVALTATPIQFHEVRESPWLASPVESRGMVRVLPQGLEKQVDFPKRETWRLLSDRLEWTGTDDTVKRQILFSKVPALAVLSDAMRRVMTGDLLTLEHYFQFTIKGDASQWTARLQPNSAEATHYLDHLELEGAGARLLLLVVVEHKGDRTTTHFDP